MEDRIISDLWRSYGIRCNEISRENGGFMNMLWRITCDEGDLLVKQYSPRRYQREKLLRVEASLQRQMILSRQGVRCPSIRHFDGKAIRLLGDDIAYMVMDYVKGKNETPETITAAQMRSLGSACGKMHSVFSTLPVATVEGYPIDNAHFLDALRENHNARMRETGPEPYRAALNAEGKVLMGIKNTFLGGFVKGVAHEDFTSDNVLFSEDSVAAIVDFDRNHYSFIRHDIGRAILSFALKDDGLDTNLIRSFIEGYGAYFPISMSDVEGILRLSWCIEANWWIRPEFFEGDQGKATRFRDEILWVMERWVELGAILSISQSESR